jgi:hypothetical protein
MRPTCGNASSSSLIQSSTVDNDDEADLDEIYNQLYPEFDSYRIALIYNNRRKLMTKRTNRRGELNSISRTQQQQQTKTQLIQHRQGEALTSGLFQLPTDVPNDQLLNPCRPGAKNGNNFKCTNSVYKL